MTSLVNVANVWVLDPSSLSKFEIVRCENVLSKIEKICMGRFRCEQDVDAYRAAHALARFALSHVEPTLAPHNWDFDRSAHGRPEISTLCSASGLRFNISHSRRLVACIVTRDLDCGVDVERIDLCNDMYNSVPVVFAATEMNHIMATSKKDRAKVFCRYWTLKEAYAKATGQGLSMPFDSIAFDLKKAPIHLLKNSFEWYFEQWSQNTSHIVAAAVRSLGTVKVVRHTGLPLTE
jgi:4'-phosphopantetheinyl transferase